MDTDDNQTSSGDHFAVYTNTEPLCCIPENLYNVICQLSLNKNVEKRK